MSREFRNGQIFISADPRDEGRRVMVLSVGGHHRPGEVYVGTVSSSGKVVRQRWMKTDQFHNTAVTAAGEVRKRGYILESVL